MTHSPGRPTVRSLRALFITCAVLVGVELGMATVNYLYPTGNSNLRHLLAGGLFLAILITTSLVYPWARLPASALLALGIAGYGAFSLLGLLIILMYGGRAFNIQGLPAFAVAALLLGLAGIYAAREVWPKSEKAE